MNGHKSWPENYPIQVFSMNRKWKIFWGYQHSQLQLDIDLVKETFGLWYNLFNLSNRLERNSHCLKLNHSCSDTIWTNAITLYTNLIQFKFLSEGEKVNILLKKNFSYNSS